MVLHVQKKSLPFNPVKKRDKKNLLAFLKKMAENNSYRMCLGFLSERKFFAGLPNSDHAQMFTQH